MRSRARDGDHAVIAAMKVENTMPHPVRAGDTLTYSAEIEAKRDSKSRPAAGVLTTRGTLTNQDGTVVFESRTTTLVAKRTPR
jgi:acyl dehydratase